MISFTFGVMGSGKTASLIDAYNEFTADGLKVAVVRTLNPVESRDGRILHSTPISVFLSRQESFDDVDVVIIDEAQFLTEQQMTKLCNMSKFRIMKFYGLLYDFNDVMFKASKRILSLASELEVLHTKCNRLGCLRPATSHNCTKTGLTKENYESVCCLHKI